MAWPPYDDIKDDYEVAVRANSPTGYHCMGCTGEIKLGEDMIDMRHGWLSHNDVTCYNLMKDYAEVHGARLEGELEKILQRKADEQT